MIQVTKFHPAYCWPLLQHDPFGSFAQEEAIERMADSPYAIAILGDDKVVACAGVVEHWPGRGEAWSMWHPEATFCERVAGIRAIKRNLDACPLRRVESTVQIDNEAGHRLSLLLGFEEECRLMRHYLPNGMCATLYVRLKKNG